MQDYQDRNAFIESMRELGVNCVFHYIPLHNSPAGQQVGRTGSRMLNTTNFANRLVRLPLWIGLEKQQAWVVEAVFAAVKTETAEELRS
jgi:dTDP-4-amino-4,6-dideoxygalactose transaminase